MPWEDWFSIANLIAVMGWAALILLPRWRWVMVLTRFVIPGVLGATYTLLAMLYFARPEAGGYNSLAEVKALLGTDPTLLAGWVHYLAFDLFVGGWIAERADKLGVSRLLQVPILFLTFQFGPIGYLTWAVIEAALAVPLPESPNLEVTA